jgi:branched-chain amino acid transport system permease protein
VILRWRSPFAIAAIGLFLALFPFIMHLAGGGITLASRILVLGLFGLGVDLLFGFTGMLSFGQAAFYGTGGFVAGYLMIHKIVPSTLGALAIGTLVAAFAGFVIGAISVRQIGVYFAMLTLAFGQLFHFLDFSPLRNFTGGENGLPGVPRPHVFGIDFATNEMTYVFIAICYFVGYIVMRRIVASPFGHVLRAILDNPQRAAATGHDVYKYKLVAFTIAAGYAGFAGGLLGLFQGYLPPDMFTIDQSGQIIVMEVIGGPGTLIGPLVGAGVWIYLSQILQNFGAIGSLWKLVLGLVFVVLITSFRRGIVGAAGALAR